MQCLAGFSSLLIPGFKCSFDEFVGEKLFSPSYSSTILAPPSYEDNLRDFQDKALIS